MHGRMGFRVCVRRGVGGVAAASAAAFRHIHAMPCRKREGGEKGTKEDAPILHCVAWLKHSPKYVDSSKGHLTLLFYHGVLIKQEK